MLRLPRFKIEFPTSYGEAAEMLEDLGAGELDRTRGTPSLRVLLVAGGTDLFPNMKRRQFTPEVLVSLSRVQQASGISENGHLLIGAGTILTTIVNDARVRTRYTALAEAAGLVSTPQLRNMGTIGGNVCLDTRCNWYDQSLFWRTAEGFCMKTNPSVVCRVATSSPRCLAVASADTVPALMVLGAVLSLEDAGGARAVPIADFYREDGIRATVMRPEEILTDITLPREEGWRSTYLKLRDRGSFDFPIAGVAAAVRWDGGTIAAARVAITALGSRPAAVDASALVGTKLEDDAIGAVADAVHKVARPMDNTSGTISQRKRAARVFAERALRSLRDG